MIAKLHRLSKPGKPPKDARIMSIMSWEMGNLFRVKVFYYGGHIEMRSYKHARSAVRWRRQMENLMREQDARGNT